MQGTITSLSDDEQTTETVFDLLSNQRRRHTLTELRERKDQVSLSELATAVTARETESDPAAVPADTVESVEVSLHHQHLPRLDASDVISYDPAQKVVTPRNTAVLDPLLTLADSSRS